MTPDQKHQAEQELKLAYYTIRAASRALSVSRSTMQKWIDAKLVAITVIGPPGCRGVRKIAREEIQRLRRVA